VSPSIPIPPYDARLTGGSPFAPIAEYAFLSDCHTAALVAPDGGVVIGDQVGVLPQHPVLL
jgi:alpha,alpha-trehalase